MGKTGVLLGGYDEESARTIKSTLESEIGDEMELFSASGMEDSTVEEILSATGRASFRDGPDKVLMLLGVERDDIQRLVRAFPAEEGLERPLFCTLTENNIEWLWKDLLDHLKEERKRFQKK